ncbi:MAG: hypothetical protein KDA98_16860 [Acidimicrobiales bacterium]|nr:hypothetical protein [Acidimicrobiales bacterium]
MRPGWPDREGIRIDCILDRDRIDVAQPHHLTWASGPDAERCFSELALLADG